ncbi:MAG: hypothetical protein WBP59_02195 [Ilumatobacteraceae bacterium]
MERLCGRPGCSDHASVAYGMRAEDLVFWLDRLPEVPDSTGGVLCQRHADSMVVPRGWTLDDLRDPDLHLFRPPTPLPPPTRVPRQRARPVAPQAAAEQLELGAQTRPTPPAVAEEPAAEEPAAEESAAHESIDAGANERDAPNSPGPWTPEFDEGDDLDGLLSARSPLLSRAFRTADRGHEQ